MVVISVYDFDDSLFCSTDFSVKKCIDNPKKLSKRICKVLNTALFFSDKVFIITNAERLWVEMVLTEILPDCKRLYSLLEIISVPDNKYNIGLDFSQWKQSAFGITLSKYFYDSIFDTTKQHHLISIGDSPHDHSAAERIGDLFPNVFVKIMRLKMLPTEEDILIQLKILQNGMQFITDHQGDLDINIKLSEKVDLIGQNILTKIPLETIKEECEQEEEFLEQFETTEIYEPFYNFPNIKIC